MKKLCVLLVLPLLALSLAFAGEEKEAKKERGFLGVYTEHLSEAMLAALNVEHGALVSGVVDESPAKEAGFEVGDLILEIDGEKVENQSDLRGVVRERPDKKVNVKLRRKGKDRSMSLTLASKEVTDWWDVQIGEVGDEAMQAVAKAMSRIGPEAHEKVKVKILKQSEDELEDLRDELEDLREELEELREELKQRTKGM